MLPNMANELPPCSPFVGIRRPQVLDHAGFALPSRGGVRALAKHGHEAVAVRLELGTPNVERLDGVVADGHLVIDGMHRRVPEPAGKPKPDLLDLVVVARGALGPVPLVSRGGGVREAERPFHRDLLRAPASQPRHQFVELRLPSWAKDVGGRGIGPVAR
jgi:hypothetical protein